jgi:3-hydroxyisobutyrate dehydrogenase-like beta-hydroxyacid dehydrogenase
MLRFRECKAGSRHLSYFSRQQQRLYACQTHFNVLGKVSIPVGEPGKASSAKLAINYLLGLNLQGLAETILFAEKMGERRHAFHYK